MPSIDERVVAMSFENQVFEQRAAQTMATLGKLDASIKSIGSVTGLQNIETAANKITLQGPMSALDKLKSKLSGAGTGAAAGFGEIDRAGNRVTLEGPGRAIDKLQAKMGQLSAGTNFTDIDKAADHVTLEGLNRALDNVTNKFSVLQGAASVALGGIASQAAMKGAAFGKSFAFGPIQDGLKEYSTNLNSIQTILANTQGQQVSGLGEVQKHLNELNTYSDKTIYNFSEMAKNIGTFTAAGVGLDESTKSIKGIANLAALSGSNSEQASRAMYQLSQAIASGRVGLQDWNSVVYAGMGGAVFQKALMRTGENMGTIAKGAVQIDKATGKATLNGESFRNSIMAKPGQQSWLTSDVLTKTLSQFTGDLSDAQLAAQGFNAEQIKTIQQTAKSAQNAATEVKTLPQVFDVARETIGSGWAQTFSLIFGNFNESKKTFTEMSNFINGFINTTSKARNKMLGDWKAAGGRTFAIEGIKQAFKDLMDIITPIKDAFRDIFPAKTGGQLASLTRQFLALMQALQPSQTTIDNLRRTFGGLFAVIHIGWSIVKGLANVLFDLLGVVGKGSGGFLGFTAGIGDFLKSVDAALTKGGLLKGFFTGLGAVLQVPLHLIGALAGAILNLFGGDHKNAAKGLTDSLDAVNSKLGPLKKVIGVVVGVWNNLTDAVGRAKTALDPWFTKLSDKLSNFGQILADAFKNMNFDSVMSGIQTGLIGGILLTLKKALGGGVNVFGGAFAGVNKMLSGLTGNLEAMQQRIKAQALLAIAAAIAVLAGGIFILSKIDGKNLSKAMTAVAIGLGELMGAMKLMMGGVGRLGILQLPVIAASMIGLATATVVLAGAMKIFATMKWEDIAKGMAGVAGAIAAVGLSMKLMGGGPFLVVQAAGLILIGAALNIIAAAMKQFASIKLTDMAKSLFAVVESLAGIALGVSMMPPTLPLTAAGLILMGIALASIGLAIKSMGSLDFGTIVKGLGAMMVAIAGIGLAISVVPPTLALTAVGLLIVGQAMVVVAGAIAILGKLGVGQLVKGLIGLAGALGILATGLTLMIVSLPGAVALMAAAAALAVLVPVLGLLGTMNWSTIFKGLAAMALVLVTIGVAGLVAAPALAAIGIALIPLGLGFMLVATGAKIFAAALASLGDSGQKGVAVMITALTGFVALLPTIVISFIKGLLSIVDSVAQLAPKVVIALGLIIDTIIAFVIQSAPKLAIAIGVLVDSILLVLGANSPKIIAAGVTLLGNLLSGISQNIGMITVKVSEIIVKFLSALASRAPDLVSAGVKTIQAFLNGISSKFGALSSTVDTMIGRFGAAVASHAVRMVAIAGNMMLSFIGGIASYVPRVIDRAAGIILAFIEGLGRNVGRIATKGADVIIAFIQGIGSNMKRIANKGADAVISFLNGMAETIRTKGPELRAAGYNVANALIDGIWSGIDELGQKVVDKLGALVKLLPKKVRQLLGISSPSSVFMEIGKFTMLGFAKGVDDNSHEVVGSAESIGTSFIGGFRKVFGIHSPSEVMREIGMQVNRGFKQGLDGSASEVTSAFSSLNDQLITNIRSQRSLIADSNTKIQDLQQQHADKLAEIAKLRADKKPDKAAIASAVKEAQDIELSINNESNAITANEAILKKNRDARALLTKGMTDEKNQLIGLKTNYEEITKKLDAARGELDRAIQARDDAQKSLTEKFDTTPTVDDASKTKVQDYVSALTQQIAATKSYSDTLAKLKAIGLDDQTYKKLVDEGLAGKDFAEQILAGGQAAVDGIKALDTQLLAASTTLATNAATALYQAGVDAAQTLVDGLASKQGVLVKQMEDLAKAMVAAIKRELKIKSPSRVMLDLGKFTAQGIIEGLRGSSQAVTDAAASIGDDVKSAMFDGLSNISDVLTSEINPDLTITPVLDLSQVQKDAQKLSDLTNVTPITAAASFGQASAASREVSAAQQVAAAAAASGNPTFSFVQNNTSPEALSDVEIYRQTKNQVGQVKKALGLVG